MKLEKKEIEVVVKENGYILTMSEEEAKILCMIVGSIGGDHPWRRFLSTLYDRFYENVGNKKMNEYFDKYHYYIKVNMMLYEVKDEDEV